MRPKPNVPVGPVTATVRSVSGAGTIRPYPLSAAGCAACVIFARVAPPVSPERLELHAVAEERAVRELREGVAAFAAKAGAVDDLVDAVRLAASEILTNVVIHAYREAPAPGPLTVEAWCEGGCLLVTVSDSGDGMVPRPDSPGLGLGMPLVAQLADDFRVADRAEGGTRVSMRFSLDGSGTDFVR